MDVSEAELFVMNEEAAGLAKRGWYISWMGYGAIRNLLILAAVLVQGSTMARAGCLVHPEQYRLQSDTVHWSMSIAAGTQCIQGLRGRTILLEGVSVVDQPKAGNLTVEGPSFRYLANATQGTDSFRLMLTGTSVRVHGISYISVDVTIQ